MAALLSLSLEIGCKPPMTQLNDRTEVRNFFSSVEKIFFNTKNDKGFEKLVRRLNKSPLFLFSLHKYE